MGHFGKWLLGRLEKNIIVPKSHRDHRIKLRTISMTEFTTIVATGNTKGRSIIVPLTSCLTGLESVV
jgi:hypothetical protein